MKFSSEEIKKQQRVSMLITSLIRETLIESTVQCSWSVVTVNSESSI